MYAPDEKKTHKNIYISRKSNNKPQTTRIRNAEHYIAAQYLIAVLVSHNVMQRNLLSINEPLTLPALHSALA
jgi:hypothetical protein